MRRVPWLALAAIVLLGWGQPPTRPQVSAQMWGGLAAVSPVVAPVQSPAPRLLPSRLVIPSIALNADLEWVGLDERGNLAVPAHPEEAAWYQGGPAPGEPGDAVIDGHLDWTTGPAVFWNLERVQVGDEIEVVSVSGDQLRFAVTDTARYPYDSHPPGLFSSEGPARLSLITCAGSWDRSRRTYLERFIVNASQVNRVG